jgi:hypothetical protein
MEHDSASLRRIRASPQEPHRPTVLVICVAVVAELLPIITIPVAVLQSRAALPLAIATWFVPGAGWVFVGQFKVAVVMAGTRGVVGLLGCFAVFYAITACLFGCSGGAYWSASVVFWGWLAIALGQPIVSALAIPLVVRPAE